MAKSYTYMDPEYFFHLSKQKSDLKEKLTYIFAFIFR